MGRLDKSHSPHYAHSLANSGKLSYRLSAPKNISLTYISDRQKRIIDIIYIYILYLYMHTYA